MKVKRLQKQSTFFESVLKRLPLLEAVVVKLSTADLPSGRAAGKVDPRRKISSRKAVKGKLV